MVFCAGITYPSLGVQDSSGALPNTPGLWDILFHSISASVTTLSPRFEFLYHDVIGTLARLSPPPKFSDKKQARVFSVLES